MSVPAAYVGVILIWSTTPLAIKWSSHGSDFMFAVLSRMTIGVVISSLLMLLMLRRPRLDKSALLTYLAAGLAIYGSMSFVYWGSQYISSGMVSVLFGLTPLLTGFMAASLLNEKSMTPVRVFANVLAFAGLVLIFIDSIHLEGNALHGILAVLIAVILHSLSSVLVKRIGAHLSALDVTHGGLLFSLPFFIVTWLLFGARVPDEFETRSMLSIAYLGIFGSVAGFMMFFYVLKNVDAARAALITLVTPVMALWLGYLLNNESLNYMILYGTGLILFAMSLYQWGHLWLNRGVTIRSRRVSTDE